MTHQRSTDTGAPRPSTVVVPGGGTGRAPDVWPTLRSIGRTLDISVRFLIGAARGHGTIAAADVLLDGWAKDIFRYGAATLAVTGRPTLEPGRPYVVMSNHGSLTDVPALIATFPGSLRMVTKEDLMKVPIWGRAMRASGFIPISRGDRQRAIEQLDLAKERLANGVAVWISPEGTRSRDGKLGPFKKGGFHLASQLQAQIIPAFVEGTDRALPAGKLQANYDVEVCVHYGTPIPTAGTPIPEQMSAVRRAILDLAEGRLEERSG